jgi:hypothetical protein
MSPKILLFVLVGSLALAACDTMPAHRWSHGKEPRASDSRILASKQCPANRLCEIGIDYEHDRSQCDPYCYPVAPAYVNVLPDTTQDRKSIMMVWKLPSQSEAKFADDGIEFQSKDSGFDGCHMGTEANRKDDSAFTCINHRRPSNPAYAGWKYTIRLELRGGAPLEPLDPSVVNR